jgi:catalase (peroxidase I)
VCAERGRGGREREKKGTRGPFSIDRACSTKIFLTLSQVIFTDPKFKPVAEKYATNEAAFLADYAAAHVKLAELGAEWESEIKV